MNIKQIKRISLLLSMVNLLVFIVSACTERLPRDPSLPTYMIIADFSKGFDFLTSAASKYGVFPQTQSTQLDERSYIEDFHLESDPEQGLSLSYHLAGASMAHTSTGLWIELDPELPTNDWSAVAFELKAVGGFIHRVVIQMELSNQYLVEEYCTVTSQTWTLCTASIVSSSPLSTQIKELKVVFIYKDTFPNSGSVLVRRAYVLESALTTPSE
ncbi:MAG: hypothetical protein IPM53_20875 [Anaerolineaceae bacterium]|nr:hypothetical protein [Anaerolineaceae bacterium]